MLSAATPRAYAAIVAAAAAAALCEEEVFFKIAHFNMLALLAKIQGPSSPRNLIFISKTRSQHKAARQRVNQE